MSPWVYDPQNGGCKIPSCEHEKICKQAEAFARTRPWYPQIRLQLRFRNQFCYVGTVEQKRKGCVMPLCRLRYFREDRWSLAFFTYSNERYEPCIFSDGEWISTLEAAIELCEPFIL